MKHVILQKESNVVSTIHNMPFHEVHGLNKTKEELLEIGFLTSSEIGEPVEQEGKGAVLCYNPAEDVFYYDYIVRPLTTDEQLQQYKKDMDNAILELTTLIAMGGNA